MLDRLAGYCAAIFLMTILCGCGGSRPAAVANDSLRSAPPLPGGAAGSIPQILAPGFISTAVTTRDVALTPDGRELYFCMAAPRYAQASIFVSRHVAGAWTEPQVAAFSGSTDHLDMEPFITPDGQQLYFVTTRPLPGQEVGNSDLWVMDRWAGAWTEPRPVGAPINTDFEEYFPAVTSDGTLYFTRADSTGQGNSIWRAAPLGEGFAAPVRLPEQVNCGTNRFNATINPAGDRLILSAIGGPDSHGLVDYFLVTRSADDVWSEPINLGPLVNDGSVGGWSSYVTPDGAEFLFMSARQIGAERPWPTRWSQLQSDHVRAGGGNPVMMRMSAAFLDSLVLGRPVSDAGTIPAGDTEPAPMGFPELTGPYLGQKLPGLEPEIFAPGIISTGLNERDIYVSPDGRTIRYGILGGALVTVMETRLEAGRWTDPVTAPFHDDRDFFCLEAASVPGHEAVIFLSNRAAPGQTQGRRWDNQNLHLSARLDGQWSVPIALPAPVTTDRAEYFPSIAADGTLYFSREDENGHPALWSAEPKEGGALGAYFEPVRLPDVVNVGADNFNATVAADESWLILCVGGHAENLGVTDYWIALRDKNGWGPARNMGPTFNHDGWQASSMSVSPAGKVLFFSSNRTEIGDFFPDYRVTRQALQEMHASPGNGGIDIWWVDATILNDYY